MKFVAGICETWKNFRKVTCGKVEEFSRRRFIEDFEAVTSFFQSSNALRDNDAKYPDAEIDDEHTSSLTSPLYLQEREASASLLQVYHSKKRKLVSTCTVSFQQSRSNPSTGCHKKRKSNQESGNCQIRIIFGKTREQ